MAAPPMLTTEETANDKIDARARRPSVTRLALSPTEAAEALGVSRDYFDLHVLPELRVVRRGRRVLIAVRELEAWLDRSGAMTLAAER